MIISLNLRLRDLLNFFPNILLKFFSPYLIIRELSPRCTCRRQEHRISRICMITAELHSLMHVLKEHDLLFREPALDRSLFDIVLRLPFKDEPLYPAVERADPLLLMA